ncbi:putative dpy-30 domain-containing protein [Erysiphe necator]|uniref:Putative dpy-30 domain-containing protein n=1 Tax=Uncinula necator TaxID=52586 RepID=A0A0B1PFF0_UNCNE|nr:putative dpy-30 domain-containing protein [Erysiphe necator]
MTDQIPPVESLPKAESRSETQNCTASSNTTPLHAPLLEGWLPAASHLYPPTQVPDVVTTTTASTQKNSEDVEMTDVNYSNENKININNIDAGSIITTSTPGAECLSTEVTIDASEITCDKISDGNATILNPAAAEPILTADVSKSRNSTPFRAATVENCIDNTNNARATSSQRVDIASTTTTHSMPKEAPLHGAPTRRYLNENVTGVLLEGMKIIVRERPPNPLKALGEYLIKRSKEIN